MLKFVAKNKKVLMAKESILEWSCNEFVGIYTKELMNYKIIDKFVLIT